MTDMNQEAQLQEIEISLDTAKEVVALGQSLERLYTNPDFLKVIQEGYFKDEALRLVYLKGDSVLDHSQQADVDNGIIAIGLLRSYFRKVFMQANQAQAAIDELEQVQTEILAGE